MSPVDNLKDRLGHMNDAFQTAYAGGWPEDGEYQALVDRFDFFESKLGMAFLKTELVIQLDDRYEGARVETIHSLEDPERMDFLKRHLTTLGLPGDLNLVELEDRLEEILDVPVKIAIVTSDRINEKTGQPYRNCYLNERLGPPMRDRRPQSDIPNDFAEQGASAPPETGDGGDGPQEAIPFAWRPVEWDQIKSRDWNHFA